MTHLRSAAVCGPGGKIHWAEYWRSTGTPSDAGPPAPQPEQVAIDVARSWSIAFDDQTHHVEVRWRSRLRRVATRAADGGNRLARRHDIAQFDVQAAQVRIVEKAAAHGVVDVHISAAAQDAAGTQSVANATTVPLEMLSTSTALPVASSSSSSPRSRMKMSWAGWPWLM